MERTPDIKPLYPVVPVRRRDERRTRHHHAKPRGARRRTPN